jgi:uncharacterized protein (TIGR02466 family)
MLEFFFPTPVYYTVFNLDDISLINTEVSEYETSVDQKKLVNPWGDTVLTNFKYGPYDHTLDHLPFLKNKILNSIKDYTEQLSVKYSSVEIIESWINYSRHGGMQNYHLHEGYDISGVYFHQTSGTDGDLIFLHPSLINRFHKITTNIESKISYTPEKGKLILFPSFLEHSVSINNTDLTRISIAFNARIT